ERLDVEAPEEREARIQTILSSLNSSQNTGEATNAPISLDFGNRATFPVEPPSELLARIEAFLPALEASNSQLLQQAENDPRSVDIEHLNREEGRYIQMDLGLGVFEERRADAGSDDSYTSD
ncbi:uncharacterized protein STEHIDRAFT_44322, partial [Stereum hirsutum FP-91666 SS1]|uniref:uncharacterized protein n=1 Tax=Stereum hirsutum (strain FP-91666) TaxID=721885 RepID=UPI000440E2CC